MKKKAIDEDEMTPERKFKKFWFAWNLVEDLLLIVAGALSIVFGIMAKEDSGGVTADTNVIENIILYVLASFVILDGLLRTILLTKNYKESESSAFLVGGFEITIGIVLMIMGSDVFFKLIINFLGVFLMVIGALFLFVSIKAIVKKIKTMLMPVLEIFFGAILIGFGIALMVIYHAGETAIRNRVSYMLIGAILAIAGIAMLIGLLLGRRKEKKDIKKANKQEVLDTQNTIKESPKKRPKKVKPEVVDNQEDPMGIEHKQNTEDDSNDDQNEVIVID